MSPPPSNLVRLPRAPSLSSSDCRLFVESVTDYAMFLLDSEGRIATWNRGAESIKGYTAEEILGQHFSRFYPPEDVTAGKPQRELETAKLFGRVEDEGWRVRKDGSLFWANVVITAIRDESGELRGFGKVTRDLTAKRLDEEALRQSEQRFHHLVDAVIDYAIFMLDATGHIATWNSGAERLKGYREKDILGRHFSVFYTEEDRRAGKPEHILDTVRREGRVEDESWRVKKDGSRFWANVVITALRDSSGKVIGFAKVTRDLTQRRHVEEELRKSEERFRLLIENIGDYAIYMLDPEGRVSTWNVGAERMKGYLATEIIGRNFALFFPQEDVDAGKPARELEAARTRGRFEDEGWRVRKDGTRFWANAIVTALYDARGALLGFAKITRDLTVRREAEEKQRALVREQAARAAAEEAEHRIRGSEERYRALSERLQVMFEGVADAIIAQDVAGGAVFANAMAAELFGFASVLELLNAAGGVLSRIELLDEQDRSVEPSPAPFGGTSPGQTSGRVVHLRDRASRRDRWVSARTNKVSGGGGEPELTITILHDITAERRQQRQTRYLAEATAALGTSLDEAEMLEALADALVPGLADWCGVALGSEEDLRPLAVAGAPSEQLRAAMDFQTYLATTRAELHGPWHVIRAGEGGIFAVDSPSAPSSSLLAPIKLRGATVGVIVFFSQGARGRYDWSHVALAEEIGRRTGAALENSRLYADAQNAARRAEEASKAKDEFLATVSHELRTPLSAILGWARLLKDRVTAPSLTKPIDVIYRNAQAQVKIIDDILDVSRVITGKFRIDAKPIDLVPVVRDALEVVRPSASAKRVELEFNAESSCCLLVADPERLQQAIWNLLSNAVKFTDTGGKVVVKVRQEGSRVVLSVSDNGVGIDPGFLPFVFDRFRQADSTTTRRVGGLGLGLALVRNIVELHRGTVEAFSEGVGRGATFTLTLPVRAVAPSDAPPAPAAPSPARPLLAGLRVLVVDDDPDALELIMEVLTEGGASVETFRSARKGFEALRTLRPHVIVSDIGMPDEDGYSFMARVRALPEKDGGNVPAVALSAFVREEDSAKAMAAGYNVHLGKPVDPRALVSVVSQLAAGNRSG